MSAERESLFADVLRALAEERISVRVARKRMRGLTPPNEPARLIKQGRWASEGGYETGDAGARAAARDALELPASDSVAGLNEGESS